MWNFIRIRVLGLLASLSVVSLSATADLSEQNEGQTNANTAQTANVLQNNATTTIQALQSLQPAAMATQTPDSTTLGLFPLHTASMTPGQVQTCALHLPQLVQPLFLIGSDNFSRTWLKLNRDQLQALHALGFLVEAQNQADLDNARQNGDGLTIIPIRADQFAAQWHLQHYPVLISAQGITQ